MANTTTTKTFKPTEAQATQIKLATRKTGVTRAEINEAMGWDAETRMPVQQVIKRLAERMGAAFETEYDDKGRAAYRIIKPAKPAKVAAIKITTPTKKGEPAAIVTAKKPTTKRTAKAA